MGAAAFALYPKDNPGSARELAAALLIEAGWKNSSFRA
jgi:hypothetical protein